MLQAGEGQIAAAQIANEGRELVFAEEQVELGVQRMAQEQLDDDLTVPELTGQASQPGFIGVGRRADGQLATKLLGQFTFQLAGALVVDGCLTLATEGGR